MVCNNCGRQIGNDEANFCEYCGQSFREQQQIPTPTNSIPANPLLPKQITVVQDNKDRPISFLSFLGSYGIFFIPVIGFFLFPIMLLVWSFSSKVSETKRNWARATLIFVILFFLYLSYMLIDMLLIPAMQEFLRGNIDSNELIRQLRVYYGL